MITGKVTLIAIYIIIWILFSVLRKKHGEFTYKLWLLTWIMIHGIVLFAFIAEFLINNLNTPLF